MRSTIDAGHLQDGLEAIVGTKRVSVQNSDLDTYARDMWPRLLLSIRDGTPLSHRPHIVVWPETVAEIVEVIRFARDRRTPIIPYGGGSGVCGGVVPVFGGITVDVKRMNAFIEVNRDDLSCTVEAGCNGERFERQLNQHGYTFGHFPSSIYCSTVGGWLATRAAGQYSTKYGKIEDRVLGVTAVTGTGEVIHTDSNIHTRRGPNWTQLLVGSEGTLGIITSARLQLAQVPGKRVLRAFYVESIEQGTEAIRRVMQRGLRPAVVRLYDELDTFVHLFGKRDSTSISPQDSPPYPMRPSADIHSFTNVADTHQTTVFRRLISALKTRDFRPIQQLAQTKTIAYALRHARVFNQLAHTTLEHLSPHGCLLIVGLEGSSIRTDVEAGATFSELERAGCKNLGEELGMHWLAHRYDVSYKMSRVFREGAFVDTMEVASSWERLRDLYRATKAAIARHALVMSHFSHAYADGCSIYFTFVGRGTSRKAAENCYDAIWRDGLTAASRVGGTISHHHGVGLLKSAHMAKEHRESLLLLSAMKTSLDPDGIMNPGKLGIPVMGEPR